MKWRTVKPLANGLHILALTSHTEHRHAKQPLQILPLDRAHRVDNICVRGHRAEYFGISRVHNGCKFPHFFPGAVEVWGNEYKFEVSVSELQGSE